jgi:HAD superfamily hydrolase (TIGR01509 family)
MPAVHGTDRLVAMTHDTLAAVLWDMDGTLIDSEPLWLESELAMLRRYGIAMPDDTQQRLVGTGLWEAAGFFQRLGVPLTADQIVAEWVAGVATGLAQSEPVWRPGAPELLESLRVAGIPCALVTMSVRSLAEDVVAHLPEGSFAAIVPGDEVEFEKPHPDPYLRGAAALGVSIDRCLALEDSPTGLRSASAAGSVAIGVPNLVSLREAPADALFPTLSGLDANSLIRAFSELRPAGRTEYTDQTAEEAEL